MNENRHFVNLMSKNIQWASDAMVVEGAKPALSGDFNTLFLLLFFRSLLRSVGEYLYLPTWRIGMNLVKPHDGS